MSRLAAHKNRRRWFAHVLLLLVVVGQFVFAAARHRGEEELMELSLNGSTAERVWSLHVLANRGEVLGGPLGVPRLNRLLNDPDPILADFPYTIGPCRLGPRAVQEHRLRARAEPTVAVSPDSLEDWWRRLIFYRRKVGGQQLGSGMRLRNQEVRWLYDVFGGRALDAAAIEAHVERRRGEVVAPGQGRRGEVLAPGADRPRPEVGRSLFQLLDRPRPGTEGDAVPGESERR